MALPQEYKVDLVAFSFSDIPHVEVMYKASIVMAGGADFTIIGGLIGIALVSYK